MKKIFIILLFSIMFYSCTPNPKVASAPTWEKGDGSQFYSSFVDGSNPHYLVHSTKDCPEIKNGFIVDHYTMVPNYVFYCQTCMDDSLLVAHRQKVSFYKYPLYGEEVMIGSTQYMKHHSAKDCPEIKNGVAYGMYLVKKDLNIFCVKCVPGDMMEEFKNNNFPDKNEN